jgi:hypothetical protein
MVESSTTNTASIATLVLRDSRVAVVHTCHCEASFLGCADDVAQLDALRHALV